METSERKVVELHPMDAYELRRMLELGDAVIILDVRGVEGYQASDAEIAGALRAPLTDLDQFADELVPESLVITYGSSATDGHAEAAAHKLIRKGFRDVRPLRGGFEAYIQSGGPVVPRTRER